jgi:hypothetical protein
MKGRGGLLVVPPLFPGVLTRALRPRRPRLRASAMASASISVPLRRRLLVDRCVHVRRRSSRVHSLVRSPPGSHCSRLPGGARWSGTRPDRRRLQMCRGRYASRVDRVNPGSRSTVATRTGAVTVGGAGSHEKHALDGRAATVGCRTTADSGCEPKNYGLVGHSATVGGEQLSHVVATRPHSRTIQV